MTEFEDNLWQRVMREHGAEIASVRRPAGAPGWRTRSGLLAVGTAAVAAIATTAVLLSSGTVSNTPASRAAFAVTYGPNGATTVRFIDQTQPTAAEIAAFNRALAAIGARTGRTEMLVQTGTGIEVRCPNGELTQTSSTTGSHGAQISWSCSAPAGGNAQSTPGA